MAEIPSDIASSAAQAGYQAREVGKERGSRGAAQAHAANHQIKAVDESGSTVETEDADTQVFTDAEGGGSQGRDLEEEPSETEGAGDSSATGITQDQDGQLHLDLEA